MPAMKCFTPGQFFDHVRSQCISCIDVCPPNKVPDKYCGSHCPQTSTGEVTGPKDVASSSFNINILFAIVPIVAVLVIIVIGIWMKWRRDKRAVRNVDSSVNIEMQSVDQPLSPCSTGESESRIKEIRMGGFPEENADHTATQLLPS